MRLRYLMLSGLAAAALAGCAKKEVADLPPPPPPPPPGAVAGSTAADRDGDGIIDGYYTADGIYHPNQPMAPPPPPPAPTPRGERG